MGENPEETNNIQLSLWKQQAKQNKIYVYTTLLLKMSTLLSKSVSSFKVEDSVKGCTFLFNIFALSSLPETIEHFNE